MTDIFSQLQAYSATVESASPSRVTGTRAPLSVNLFGAVRTLLQNPDGTDVDFTAPIQTTPGRTATATVTQYILSTTATSVLSLNAARLGAQLLIPTGTTLAFWGTSSAVTTSTGFAILPLVPYSLPHGYTGPVYVISSGTPTLCVVSI